MSRLRWSRWTAFLLALVACLTSPGLALAHGVAHAHAAEAHHEERRNGGHEQVAQPEPDHAHELAGHQGHDAPVPVHSGDDVPVLSGPEHGHQHDHVRVESASAVRSDTRDGMDAPVVSAPVDAALPSETLSLAPPTRWDAAALARPAPDSGPPPTLRAPPTR
ncbi:hypothetical protein [Gemmatimonas sp. UBA7669]|uniref:hypothetical protein n=1 Tax=Gemmatimonas sp. UBA7669 TaxID=1946568 RepID=UPI0025C4117B|nr:hypothetical protein [Gemmatimonas sp. UBA7669]